jgi:hypothetical protein
VTNIGVLFAYRGNVCCFGLILPISFVESISLIVTILRNEAIQPREDAYKRPRFLFSCVLLIEIVLVEEVVYLL